MADEDDKRSDRTSGGDEAQRRAESASGQRRPTHTIDLKASEVAEDGDAAAAADQESEQAGGEDGADAAAGADETPETAAGGPREPPQRSSPGEIRGFVTHLAAGLVGGVIGVVGLGIGLDRLSPEVLTGDGTSAATEALTERVAGLESEIAALRESLPADGGAAPAEAVQALRERASALEENANARQQDLAAVNDRLAGLEETIRTLSESAGEGGDVGQTAAITQRIDEVASRLEDRIEALEKQAGADSAAASEEELAALRREVEALERRIGEQAAGAAASGAAAGEGAALAVRFAALARAVERGEPHADELAALREAAPEALDLSAFETHAEQGAPTVAALTQRFDARAEAAREAARTAETGDSLVDQFLANARSVVRVRRLDAGEGDSAAAVLARMRARLAAGDLGAALDEAEALPEEARAALDPWLEQAQARLRLDAALEQVSNDLAQRLAGAPARAQ